MKYKYSDSNPLHTIEKGYNESTRMLMFASTPLGTEQLQEALDIIGKYNDFDSKVVGKALLDKYPGCRFVVGREYSVVVYVIPTEPYLFWASTLTEIQKEANIDEVGVNNRGELRLWWD